MIHFIRTSRFSKIVASYLALQLVVMTVQPSNMLALTGGPAQPEFNSFTPIGTSDMVNLSSGDFNYNIPIMDVGGYPLNLAYDSGISMDQEASWVGLGWNLNVGQINRQVRGIPDDFMGDEMFYENNLEDNKTVGFTARISPQIFGGGDNPNANQFDDSDSQINYALTMQYNNYEGISFKPSFGFSFDMAETLQVGMNLTSSATEGVGVYPNIGLSKKLKSSKSTVLNGLSGGLNLGVGFNSRQGLTSLNLSASLSRPLNDFSKKYIFRSNDNYGLGGGGSISFINNTFTPVKRNAFNNNNFTFSASYGADIWGVDLEIGVDLFAANQSLTEEDKSTPEKAFGYEYTGLASDQDILDFNREKDNIVTKNTLVLPVTNYTYDLYAINGQGIGGQFRPFSGQVGYVYDQFKQDQGNGGSFGGEAEGGTGFHVGLDLKLSPSESHTSAWNTNATSFFNPGNPEADQRDYEPTFFKAIGELRVDDEYLFFNDQLGGKAPVALEIGGNGPGKYGRNQFRKKVYNANNVPVYENPEAFSGKLKRTHRERRNQAITKFTKEEAAALSSTYNGVRNGALITPNSNAAPHHTAGMHIMQPDGSRYIYGETAYNKEKHEVTFAVDGNGNCTTGLVPYNSNISNGKITGDNSRNNNRGLDNFYNRITTPDYAHTYLLSSVLSADYEDLTGDGPTDDDLGAYTRFTYSTIDDDFQWRIPYQEKRASYNEGLKTHPLDEKGNYVYGVKELKYIEKVETKTHVAVFEISPRNDGYGVDDENGGGSASTSSKMYKLDKISLYAKPEYQLLQEYLNDSDPSNDDLITAIKEAHFEYTYDLCLGVPNNHHPSSGGGKLTLDQVYFTYRDSQMGKFTPYQFNYEGFNPAYNLKGYDVWGNYKPNDEGSCSAQGPTTAAEFPFVQQQDRELQDQYASAWAMTSIDLPSGGRLEMQYESDDYQYVQNRKAMQMFKIAGVTKEDQIPGPDDLNDNVLFNPDNFNQDVRYLIVEVAEDLDAEDFKEQYLGEHLNKPIFFRFMTQMVRNQSESYDYVTGYFNIDENENHPITTFNHAGKYYGAIPMEFLNMEGGINGSSNVNPISKAAWYFGRQYLNRQVYGLDLDPGNESLGDIADALGSSVAAIVEIFQGPNESLRRKQTGRLFNPEKSWIRLQHSGKHKLGGGCRIKQVALHDQWDAMVGVSTTDENILKRYRQYYGQEYNYNFEDGASSGVATYEPNLSKENPLVEPFYNQDDSDYLVAPKEQNFVEKPFGESFFPAPTVTYRRVEVKNLQREDAVTGEVVRKHATGTVVNEFYTCYDFPTETDFTTINTGGYYTNENDAISSILEGLLGLRVETETELTLSQGFVVRTNDMNGRQRKQSVYNENDAFISGVDYIYSTDTEGKLKNTLPVIYPDGRVEEQEIGTHYDMITDFRESYAKSETFGIQTNLAVLPCLFPIIVPTGFPERAQHENTLQMATTTKVVHTTGIMKEKIAYDLGSKVNTENVAWDSESGQVLLTRTINEYDDHYYNTTYPAHWYGRVMDKATNNLGIEGKLLYTQGDPDTPNRANFTLESLPTEGIVDTRTVFQQGDELLTYGVEVNNGIPSVAIERLWVVNREGNTVLLMNRNGKVINQTCSDVEKLYDLEFKIIRSGYRNQHTASMASVTSQVNPIDINDDATLNDLSGDTFNSSSGLDYKIVNASAVRYGQLWQPQEEMGLPRIPTSIMQGYANAALDDNTLGNVPWENFGFNPYVYNALGEVRAVNSYAYLSGRDTQENSTSTVEGAAPRRQGFFTDFEPFYMITGENYSLNPGDKWTFASEVTQYSPYGAELENRDALDRYSAAQYGYNYTLPTAVASNSQYKEIGYDGFEDYRYAGNGDNDNAHFAVATDITTVTDETAHTGRYSVKVNGGTEVTLNSVLNAGAYEVEQPPDCSDGPPSPVCFDATGITINPNENCGSSGTVQESFVIPGQGSVTNINATVNCNGTNINVSTDFDNGSIIIEFESTGCSGALDEVVGTLFVSYTINGNPIPCSFSIPIVIGNNC